MIGSILMLGSSLNNKKSSKLFMLLWILYMLTTATNLMGNSFIIVNLGTFLVISFAISKIKNKNINLFLAPMSIILWSIIIDIICYFYYPYFIFDQSLFEYIMAGIIFNFRFAIMNYAIVISCIVIKKITNIMYDKIQQFHKRLSLT